MPTLFLADPHAAKYRDVVDDHAEAFTQALEIIDLPGSGRRMEDAERMGHPALQGVVFDLEEDPVVAPALASTRFRQAVGVAVRLRMERSGWSTTGRKGSIRGAEHFCRAERYEPPSVGFDQMARLERAFAAIEAMSTEEERAETGELLMKALAETRAAEGRPF